MSSEDIVKYLDSLHSKIVRSSFAKNVTENEITALIECKGFIKPKKPRFYAHNFYCGNCDSLVGNNEFKWQRFKYCDNCGQAIDWSDTE